MWLTVHEFNFGSYISLSHQNFMFNITTLPHPTIRAYFNTLITKNEFHVTYTGQIQRLEKKFQIFKCAILF